MYRLGISGPDGLATVGSTTIYTSCVSSEVQNRRPCGNKADIDEYVIVVIFFLNENTYLF